MKRALLAILICAASFYGAGAASAQADAVIEHYRAYRAALETGDLNAAEAAAETALAASEARDGGMGNTAVLAMNLALVRLQKEEGGEAVAPAQRALELAEARGEASGVDTALARLALRRAELAVGAEGAMAALLESLQAVADRQGAAADIYPAAAELGLRAFREENFETAQAAWSLAASQGDEVGTFALARAKLGEGASIVMEQLNGRRHSLSEGPAEQAALLIIEARNLLAPLAEIEAPGGGLTTAQLIYAESLAWRAALRVTADRDGINLDDELEAQGDAADGLTETLAPAADPRPRCLFRPEAVQRISYPRDALRTRSFGSVVVRLQVDPAGQVVDHGVVTGVGAQVFQDAVAEVRDWRVELDEESPTDCRMQSTVLLTVVFRFG